MVDNEMFWVQLYQALYRSMALLFDFWIMKSQKLSVELVISLMMKMENAPHRQNSQIGISQNDPKTKTKEFTKMSKNLKQPMFLIEQYFEAKSPKVLVKL